MKKINWDIEEAVALIDLYFKNNGNEVLDNDLELLQNKLKKRADKLNLDYDEKFRNITGLKMQLKCIQYIESNEKYGLSSGANILYEGLLLHDNNILEFNKILKEFNFSYRTN